MPMFGVAFPTIGADGYVRFGAGAAAAHAPSQPTLSAGTLTSSGATLTGSAFSDADVGDTHAASQWQVTLATDPTYASPVISTGDDAVNKTSYAATGLTPSTNYIARVRYKDSTGRYSLYATSAAFTTSAAVTGIALVNHTKGAGASTFTTPAIDTRGATLLVCTVAHSFGGGAVAFSDSKGNAWTPGTDRYSGGSVSERIYYCENPTVDAAHTFTLTGASFFASVQVSAWSGTLQPTSFQVESTASAGVADTSQQPGSVTPAADGYLVITGLGSDIGSTGIAVNSGFTILEQSVAVGGTNFGGALAYLIQTPAAAVNPTWSWTTNTAASACIAVFKHA